MIKLMLNACSILLWASAAMAADRALPHAEAGPVATPAAASWSGFTLGASGAVRWNKVLWQTNTLGIPAAPAMAGTGKRILDSAGPRAGAYAGYARQFGTLVLGIEADAMIGRERRGTRGLPGTFVGAAWSGDRLGSEIGLDGSLRLRAGYLTRPDVLLYGTGGVTVQRSSLRMRCDGGAGSACGGAREQSVSRTGSAGRSDWASRRSCRAPGWRGSNTATHR